MASHEKDQWEEFWEEQEDEVKREEKWNPVTAAGWVYIYFVSRSNGRGRKRRRYPRDVELAKNTKTGISVPLDDVPRGKLDVTAEELLMDHYPAGTNYFEVFLTLLKSR